MTSIFVVGSSGPSCDGMDISTSCVVKCIMLTLFSSDYSDLPKKMWMITKASKNGTTRAARQNKQSGRKTRVPKNLRSMLVTPCRNACNKESVLVWKG